MKAHAITQNDNNQVEHSWFRQAIILACAISFFLRKKKIHAGTSINLSPARAHIGKEASLTYVFNIKVENEVTELYGQLEMA
jgi:hypothetical protein